jgi:hypothetical protein
MGGLIVDLLIIKVVHMKTYPYSYFPGYNIFRWNIDEIKTVSARKTHWNGWVKNE